MYSLNCSYYTKSHATLEALIDDIITSGMDPNYEVTYKGRSTGDMAIVFIWESGMWKDLIQF